MSVPNAIGATCCYLIHACERVRDFDRAAQWCEKVQRFCRQVHWASLFALCRTHHASVLLWQGAWSESESELQAATRELEATRPGHVPDGLVRLAELRRRQGRLDEAQDLLESVRFAPQALFGLAAVALDRGNAADALDLVHRFLRHVPGENRTDRAAAFELRVRAHSALGRADDARAAVSELEALAEALGTDPLRASVALARGLLASAEGQHVAARRHLEDAVDLFESTRAPFEAACARLDLARALADLDRNDLAAQEARAAHGVLVAIGADLETDRAVALLASTGAPVRTRRAGGEERFGLSARELEVLALVARGLSNPRIAETLVLSEHTVRRHVANILRKLDAPSRSAAAALAARQELL